MGLLDKAKRVLKGSKGEAPPPSGSAPAAEATTSKDRQQSIDTEIRPVEARRLLGANVWSPGVSSIVDIVFLHGLTGDREKTWTADNATKPWPKALLATDITNARIITYGYDADVAHWMKPAGQNTVREHAQNLVNDLCGLRARTKTSKQPVLFVAHSLGGLVCQDALLLCVNPNDEAQGTLLDSTRGVAFMGTPNAGSDFEMFATAVANIIGLSFVKAPNTQLLEVLKGRSQVLANIKNGFLTMIRRRVQAGHPEIKIHAFVEELPVTATGHRVVTPESAVIPGYNSTTIPANHMNMTKFSKRSEVGYERILGRLMDWVSGIEDASEGTKVTVIRRNTVNDLSVQEAMNDPKLGNKNYYRYPKQATKFIQRPDLISKITSLTTQEAEASARVCILYGMGGQGKTALAVDFCRQAETKHLFLAIFWLDASTEEALKKSLVAISDVVKHSVNQTFGSNDERIDFTLQLIESWNRSWLLVFDNYDNPHQFQNLRRYIPPSSQGSILVTSRNLDLAGLGTVVEVPPMSQKEALSLLYDRVGGAEKFPEQEDYAVKIVDLLGYLPLAINQAGAYIHRRVNFPLSRFIDEYEERKDLIWSKAPTVWEYKKLVYTTWEMSFELIDEDENERAQKGQILTMLSFLDFRNISQEIFKIPRRLASIPAGIAIESPRWLQVLLTENGEWDWSKLEDLFLDFRDLSLLQLSPLGPGALRLSMHPLVSEWIKYRADLKTKRECLLQAIAIVNMSLRAKLLTVERPLLSAETEQQLFRHKFSCTENLRALQKKDSTFLSDLYPFLDSADLENTESVTDAIKEATQHTHETITENSEDLQEATRRTYELSKALQDNLSKVSNNVQDLLDNKMLQYDSAILEWLAPYDYWLRLSDYLSRAVKGSGTWFINHPVFQEWVQGKHQELWCYGSPGSGKTVIASQAAEYLFQSLSFSLVLLIYCNFKQSDQQTIKNVLGSLLRQAVQQTGPIPNEVRDYFERAQSLNAAPTLEEVKTWLFSTFRRTERSIYIIIDGLEELQPESWRVIDILRDGLAGSAAPKIMVTSRRHDSLAKERAITPTIEIKAHEADIRALVKASLTHNSCLVRFIRHDPALKEEIEESVVGRSMGMMLLAKLLIDELSSVTTIKSLRNALRTLPHSLDYFYEATLQRISSQNSEDADLANLVLMWLGFSYRSMSHRELQHALAVTHIQPGKTYLGEELLISTDVISDVCAGLVMVDEETDIIRLCHFSAQEYLEHVRDQRFPEAQVEITRSCLVYLSLEPFASGPCLETKLRDRILEYPFVVYAAEFWLLHAKRNEKKHIGQVVRLLTVKKIYESWIQILKSIEELASGDPSPEGVQVTQVLGVRLAACTTPLEAAKLLGLDLVATTLAESGICWQ